MLATPLTNKRPGAAIIPQRQSHARPPMGKKRSQERKFIIEVESKRNSKYRNKSSEGSLIITILKNNSVFHCYFHYNSSHTNRVRIYFNYFN